MTKLVVVFVGMLVALGLDVIESCSSKLAASADVEVTRAPMTIAKLKKRTLRHRRPPGGPVVEGPAATAVLAPVNAPARGLFSDGFRVIAREVNVLPLIHRSCAALSEMNR